jgi:hypothetical protein
MIRPVCFRQGKNLAENLRQTLRSLSWDSHHIPDVANGKFCLLLRFSFRLMFAPLGHGSIRVQWHNKQVIDATIVMTTPRSGQSDRVAKIRISSASRVFDSPPGALLPDERDQPVTDFFRVSFVAF